MLKMLLQGFKTVKSKVVASPYLSEMVERIHNTTLRDSLEDLKRSPRYQDPKSLIPHGYTLYSQGEEDGMICEIFKRIGVTNKTFVEFGAEYGLQNNTLALLFEEWRGLWIEGGDRSAKRIFETFGNTIKQGRLKVIHSFVTRENINDLIGSAGFAGEIDLLSVDIDGNDFHVLEAITCVKPRVIVVEYNAKFPPHLFYCMAYDATHSWKGDDCYGASLKYMEVGISRLGYNLVGCSLSGANAFFVRTDLVGDKFLAPFTAENHYEPPRHQFGSLASGHAASARTLETAILKSPARA